jgi:hypothetical protein
VEQGGDCGGKGKSKVDSDSLFMLVKILDDEVRSANLSAVRMNWMFLMYKASLSNRECTRHPKELGNDFVQFSFVAMR